jgi:hypothetical protein
MLRGQRYSAFQGCCCAMNFDQACSLNFDQGT